MISLFKFSTNWFSLLFLVSNSCLYKLYSSINSGGIGIVWPEKWIFCCGLEKQKVDRYLHTASLNKRCTVSIFWSICCIIFLFSYGFFANTNVHQAFWLKNDRCAIHSTKGVEKCWENSQQTQQKRPIFPRESLFLDLFLLKGKESL